MRQLGQGQQFAASAEASSLREPLGRVARAGRSEKLDIESFRTILRTTRHLKGTCSIFDSDIVFRSQLMRRLDAKGDCVSHYLVKMARLESMSYSCEVRMLMWCKHSALENGHYAFSYIAHVAHDLISHLLMD